MARRNPWIPTQYGAWALLLLPIMTAYGRAIRLHDFSPFYLPATVAMISAYLAFNAYSVAISMRPHRRSYAMRVVWIYSSLLIIAGLITAIMNPSILWWTILAAPVVAVALRSVQSRRERSISSGISTLILASGTFIALRIGDPSVIFTSERPAYLIQEIALFIVIICYEIGTVFHVKSLIRERLSRRAALRSAIYHLISFTIVTLCIFPSWLNDIFLAIFAFITIRAALLPILIRHHRLSVGLIGSIEMAITITISIAAIAL